MVLTIHEHFPPHGPLETPAVLRALVVAHRHLAGLKGVPRSTPGTVLKNERSGEVVYQPPSPEQIARLLHKQKHEIRAHYRFYSLDLINNIFYPPYTKVAFFEHDLGVSRVTATRYLDELAKGDILDKHRLGRENYYINRELVALLFNLPPLDMDGVP
ncbi:Fic family protein [Idiomarina abyssalis]|uniref:hypothetical protein n=1 Tax=Idiomarina abyssalis TaxID=86102 RepID=UPI001CD791DD|nr:hypothetical protein [Idiomarina abyssalis]